jgi:hypothetical protein
MDAAFRADLDVVSGAVWRAAIQACEGRKRPATLTAHALIAVASKGSAVLVAAGAKAEGRSPATAEVEMLVTAFRDGVVHCLQADHGLAVAPAAG